VLSVHSRMIVRIDTSLIAKMNSSHGIKTRFEYLLPRAKRERVLMRGLLALVWPLTLVRSRGPSRALGNSRALSPRLSRPFGEW